MFHSLLHCYNIKNYDALLHYADIKNMYCAQPYLDAKRPPLQIMDATMIAISSSQVSEQKF